MTADEIRAALEAVRAAYGRYRLAREKAAALRDMAVGDSSRLSDIPHVRNGNITENKYVYFIDGSEEAARLFAEYEDIRVRAEVMICSLSSDAEKEVLTRRYLLFQKWEDVSEKMGFSREHIRRIHNRAIENICKKI